MPNQVPNGERLLHISHDAGVTWTSSAYAADGYRPVYSITPHPGDPRQVWLGSHAGLYHGQWDAGYTSITWQRIAGPSDGLVSGEEIDFGHCYGAAISPDGAWIYATFTVDGPDEEAERFPVSVPFSARVSDILATPTDASVWIALAGSDNIGELAVEDDDTIYGDGNSDRGANYWRPVIDPRSTGTNHSVLLGQMAILSGGRNGLFEAHFDVSGDTPSGQWLRVYGQDGAVNDDGSVFSYETPWQNLTTRGRHAAYTPTTWPQRNIYSAPDQQLYVGQSSPSDRSVALTSWQT